MKKDLVAKPRSSPTNTRGCLQQPHSVAATNNCARVLAVKIDLDTRTESGRKKFQRIRDLSWQAAQYRNGMIRRKWAEAMGWQVPESDDKHSITKQGRKTEKGELSGAAYSAAEQEVQGAWQRDAKFILAGRPLPEWRTDSALSIRGHKNQNESGVRLELENGQFVAYLSVQNKDCEGGCWLQLPISKHTKRDEYQGEILEKMVSWEIPIAKATVQIKQKKRQVIVRFTHAIERTLPKMGERVATLGPIEKDNRLHLRTETQTKDFTSRYLNVLKLKGKWELIRRRALRQIGWKHGHARSKRKTLAQLSWDDWLHTYLHTWSREMVIWCVSQGVGIIRVVGIDTEDWPAFKFLNLIRYKAEECGIVVNDKATLDEESTERAADSAVKKQQRKLKKRREAITELEDQLET